MKNKIISFFKKNPNQKFKTKELQKKLNLDEYQYQQLKFILNQLQKEMIIEKVGKRYQYLHEYSGTLKGTLDYIPDGGYGFVQTTDAIIKDVFIPNKYLNTAFHGDFVEVELAVKKKGKNYEGKIIRVLERKRTEIIGTLKKTKSFYFVQPDDKKLERDILVPKNKIKDANKNDKVIVGNIVWENPKMNPEGEVIEVLGNAQNYELEILSIARENNFPISFSEKVEEELANLSNTISKEEINSRFDFRDDVVFTIDPEDAKDYDDALSIKKLQNGNFQVGIHIADVSHYVQKGTALFEEAAERATSVYFVGKVLPMLPEKLSNGICSLVADEDRLTFSVIAELTTRGKLIDYKIGKSIIRSKKRFTYEEAQQILENGKGQFYDELFHLDKLAKTLRTKRFKTGSINFHSNEVKFILNEKFEPIKISKRITIDTNNLVEEYMLLANKVVATYFSELKLKESFIYRIHDLPDREKMIEFAKFVKTLGFSFDPNSSNNPKQFQFLLEKASGTAEEILINDVAIRSMAKAEYSTRNIGHYGLAFKYYSHFTSPIRRFPDLIVHQILFDKLNKNAPKFSNKEIEQIADYSSKQERNAVSAERISVKIKQVEFMQKHLGDVFDGIISGITNFGIFVELTETLTEGLIKLKDIENDFYIFDETQFSLIGKRTGKRFRLGDKLRVQVVRVDEKRREIDFVLSDD